MTGDSILSYITLFPVQQAEMPANVSAVYEAYINTTHIMLS